jgi:hypothetical protein
MSSIDTYEIDDYIQGLLKDRTLSSADRARNAAGAIKAHVLTHARLPLTTETYVPNDTIQESFDRLAATSQQAWEQVRDSIVDAEEALGLPLGDEETEEAQEVEAVTQVLDEIEEAAARRRFDEFWGWQE